MHEYEFRLVVEHPFPFLPILQELGYPLRREIVYYALPHFRYKDGRFEKKQVESVEAIYHDALWFRWVHSVETSFHEWSRPTLLEFLHVFNYQNPFTIETRYTIDIDSQVKLYTFQSDVHMYRLVFEWEYGTFSKPLTQLKSQILFRSLSRYEAFYGLLRPYTAPSYVLNEQLSRKPVTCIESIPEERDTYLYAHKLDGVFGLVYSYRDHVKEKWEGYECVVRKEVSLGDGLVFAAERLEDGQVYLLDVYHVRGHNTAPWCRKQILTHFLPSLTLWRGYNVQRYVEKRNALETKPSVRTDGIVVHDVVKDVIFKYKTQHSVDLVHYQGYFYLPNGRIQCSQKDLEDGSVYEISTRDGSVLRQRTDRFKGNSLKQLNDIFKNGWYDPKVEPFPSPIKSKSKVLGKPKKIF